MANRQRGPLPPVMSTEETRVKPPEEDEQEVPPEEPSWDPQRDSTQLMPNKAPPAPPLDWTADEDATPFMPSMAAPTPPEEPDATRPIRKTGARPALQEPDDATRPIPRKSSVRPALQEPDDATRPIPRKTAARPALQEPDDGTRPIPRKSSVRPALQDADDATRPVPRKSAIATREPSAPWEPITDDGISVPTGARALPPIAPASYPSTPPSSPPVLSPSPTAPPRVPAALFGATTHPGYMPEKPPVLDPAAPEVISRPPTRAPAPSTLFTQPNYVSPPPDMVAPVVTSPHLAQIPHIPAGAEPPGEELRTAFSNKAALIADLIKATFARRSYGSAPYRLRIDEPDGPSTGGGRQARQPISLVANLESAPAIVCGWVDVAKKESQLRSYPVVAKRHKVRYGIEPDIFEAEYEQFLNELVDTLFYGGIKILVQVPDEQEAQQQAQGQAQAPVQPQPQGSRSCLGTLLLLSLTFALGVGAGMNAERFAPLIDQVMALIGQR